jgi:hypothetical protein
MDEEELKKHQAWMETEKKKNAAQIAELDAMPLSCGFLGSGVIPYSQIDSKEASKVASAKAEAEGPPKKRAKLDKQPTVASSKAFSGPMKKSTQQASSKAATKASRPPKMASSASSSTAVQRSATQTASKAPTKSSLQPKLGSFASNSINIDVEKIVPQVKWRHELSEQPKPTLSSAIKKARLLANEVTPSPRSSSVESSPSPTSSSKNLAPQISNAPTTKPVFLATGESHPLPIDMQLTLYNLLNDSNSHLRNARFHWSKIEQVLEVGEER